MYPKEDPELLNKSWNYFSEEDIDLLETRNVSRQESAENWNQVNDKLESMEDKALRDMIRHAMVTRFQIPERNDKYPNRFKDILVKTDDGISLLEVDTPSAKNRYGHEHGGSSNRFDNSELGYPGDEEIRFRLARASTLAKEKWNLDVDVTQKASKIFERSIGFLEKLTGKFGRAIDKHVFRIPTALPNDDYEKHTTAGEQYGILWRLSTTKS